LKTEKTTIMQFTGMVVSTPDSSTYF